MLATSPKTVVPAQAGIHAECADLPLARLWLLIMGPRLRGDDVLMARENVSVA
ncbi:hypothetical protein GCM10027318_24590 [Massilia agilis]